MKKEKLIRILLVTAGFAAFFSGCKSSNDAELIAEENRYFDLYMNSHYPGLEPLESGLYYIEERAGTGMSPDSGDYVLINYVAKTIPEGTVFDTYVESIAEENGIHYSGVLYGPLKYAHGSEIAGLREGLSMMKEGGVSTFIFKSDLGFGADGFGSVSAYTSLQYDMELVEVIRAGNVEQHEDSIIAAILDTISVPYETIHDEDTGADMYYIEWVTGEDDYIDSLGFVSCYYTGRLPDGRVFDSNVGDSSPYEVNLGDQGIIAGWNLGLPHFRYGGSGTLIIPYQLAYGIYGMTDTNSGKTGIPPYQTLIFDITVDPAVK